MSSILYRVIFCIKKPLLVFYIYTATETMELLLFKKYRTVDVKLNVVTAIIPEKVNKSVTKRDWKEMNGDNDIQITFIFQRNLHTNLNTCLAVSQVPWNLRRKILVVAVETTHTLLFHRPTDWMFVLDTCSPFRELLHPIMDCLTWQAMFTVHGQHFFVDILCCHTFCPTKTAQRHAVLLWYTYSGAPPSCNSCSVSTVMRIPIVARHDKTR